MTTFLKLKNPPIKEIIFTISYNEIIDKAGLQRFIEEPLIKGDFKLVGRAITKQIDIKDDSENVKLRNLHDGFILTSESNNKVIQIKKGSFSFHKFESYQSYDELLETLMSYWNLLDKSTSDHLIVNNISVRYVNFIPKNNDEKISDLLTIYTQSNFDETVVSARNQITLKDNIDEYLLINIFTAIDNSQNGIILDISLSKSIDEKTNQDFYDDLKKIRGIKNQVFFKCITQQTQNKFNYE